MSELDVVLRGLSLRNRKLVRDMMIVCSSSSFDPIDTFKENLTCLKNRKYANEIRDCISSFCNVPQSMANDFLRNSILRKHKFRRLGESTYSQYNTPQQPQSQHQQQIPGPHLLHLLKMDLML